MSNREDVWKCDHCDKTFGSKKLCDNHEKTHKDVKHKSSFFGKFLLFVVIVAVIYLGLYMYSLSTIEIRDVNFNQIQDISFSGFTLGGYVEVYNGGIVPVGIDHIEYIVELESSQKTLSQGTIIGKTINPKESQKYETITRIDWSPATEVGMGLILPGQTYATVSGYVYVADLVVMDVKLPFRETVDLEPFLKQFIKDKVREVIQNTGETIVDTAKGVWEGIKGIFN